MLTQPQFRLGRLAKRHDPRTLKLAKYFKTEALPQIPATCRWGQGVNDWLMLANDSVGDCTIAAALHMIMLWRKEHKIDFSPTDVDALALYEQFAGYDPAKPETDHGAVELDILKSWRNTGIAGKPITAFASIDATNLDHLRAATWLFGAVYVGANLTQCAMSEFQAGSPWSQTHPRFCGKKLLGGHAFPLIGYDKSGFLAVTWGKVQRLTEPWWLQYGDEAWAVISTDWATQALQAPCGFEIDALLRDLAQIS